jgi:hypothetical protein
MQTISSVLKASLQREQKRYNTAPIPGNQKLRIKLE